ncbi:hypothetical protein BCR33DRAFT_450440 [Rhizoclosmatium globosum]|uniref:Uncharacterized protein n=1 Tax=Rhizoclosmatium globosum TaxID=329046 RepID=A0A1Y2CW82_9FUNG|nr:hypothetical protein BCR33DRAFT_450440 [Rhizoclosmatium globosum]|eukprot:ORY51237.1 hypothetical protein BCR33DRAFT_450440 [Rhizoclosmatium globosum]
MNQFRAKLRSPELLLSPDFDVNKDPAALNRPYANILSNLIQTMLKLPSPDLKQIIKFSTEVLTLHYSKEEGTNQYFLRSLHARAQAHTKLEMWDEAIQDWEYTLSLCDGAETTESFHAVKLFEKKLRVQRERKRTLIRGSCGKRRLLVEMCSINASFIPLFLLMGI